MLLDGFTPTHPNCEPNEPSKQQKMTKQWSSQQTMKTSCIHDGHIRVFQQGVDTPQQLFMSSRW